MKIHPTCNNCHGDGKVTYKGKKYDCTICNGKGKLMGTTITESKGGS